MSIDEIIKILDFKFLELCGYSFVYVNKDYKITISGLFIYIQKIGDDDFVGININSIYSYFKDEIREKKLNKLLK